MKVLNSYILCQLIRNICEIKLQYLLQILYTYLDLKADFAAMKAVRRAITGELICSPKLHFHE